MHCAKSILDLRYHMNYFQRILRKHFKHVSDRIRYFTVSTSSSFCLSYAAMCLHVGWVWYLFLEFLVDRETVFKHINETLQVITVGTWSPSFIYLFKREHCLLVRAIQNCALFLFGYCAPRVHFFECITGCLINSYSGWNTVFLT